MNTLRRSLLSACAVLLCGFGGAAVAAASAAPPAFTPPPPTPNDTLRSPVVGTDGQVTFSLYAPRATRVSIEGEWLPFRESRALQPDARGVWSATLPVPPGTFRYTFNADGAITLDSRNPEVSASFTQVRSVVHVDAAPPTLEDVRDVPHGAISTVHYRSASLGQMRRMHVYTPPGYERGSARYPVLYLLHGGGDSDDSWTSVGRAGVILDNLIAAGQARPMLVVMPAGHVAGDGSIAGARSAMGADAAADPFTGDFLGSVIPVIEDRYRVSKRPEDRALAGLSMGGLQTANIGLTHSDQFHWIGIFSSGWFDDVRPEVERRHGADLDRAAQQLSLLWVGWGQTDIARANSLAMLKLFDQHGLRYRQLETPGGHTWENWRHYLGEFVPLLFQRASH